ncbi:hypothetical protein ABW19_dt0207378 [Dactylella cylindrospora]|nr:hypothetical protein ABW19_dt0207378 [Dactylella cylindrospora]
MFASNCLTAPPVLQGGFDTQIPPPYLQYSHHTPIQGSRSAGSLPIMGRRPSPPQSHVQVQQARAPEEGNLDLLARSTEVVATPNGLSSESMGIHTDFADCVSNLDTLANAGTASLSLPQWDSNPHTHEDAEPELADINHLRSASGHSSDDAPKSFHVPSGLQDYEFGPAGFPQSATTSSVSGAIPISLIPTSNMRGINYGTESCGYLESNINSLRLQYPHIGRERAIRSPLPPPPATPGDKSNVNSFPVPALYPHSLPESFGFLNPASRAYTFSHFGSGIGTNMEGYPAATTSKAPSDSNSFSSLGLDRDVTKQTAVVNTKTPTTSNITKGIATRGGILTSPPFNPDGFPRRPSSTSFPERSDNGSPLGTPTTRSTSSILSRPSTTRPASSGCGSSANNSGSFADLSAIGGHDAPFRRVPKASCS